MKRVRAKAEGEFLDVSDEEAKELLARGTHEEVGAAGEQATPATEPKRGRYTHRALRVED